MTAGFLSRSATRLASTTETKVWQGLASTSACSYSTSPRSHRQPSSQSKSRQPKENLAESKKSSQAPIQHDIPSSSLRSLIALHHSAANFVTLQNLDSVIDREFATSNAPSASASVSRIEQTMGEVNRSFRDHLNEPKLKSNVMSSQDAFKRRAEQDDQAIDWSSAHLTPRMAAVKATLWGVSVPSAKPGLETLEESLVRKQGEQSQ